MGMNSILIFASGDLDLLPSLRQLLPVLVTPLSFGGSLAVQIPNNLYEPNRALLRMVAADGPWAKKLLPVAKTRPFNEMMEGLYALLSPVCASVDIWETIYLYALKGVGAIIDLMKATSPLWDRTGEGISGAARRQGPFALC